MLEEKSIYLVFEYAEHDFLVGPHSLPLPLALPHRDSSSYVYSLKMCSKSFITIRRLVVSSLSESSNLSSGNSSTAFLTYTTIGSYIEI